MKTVLKFLIAFALISLFLVSYFLDMQIESMTRSMNNLNNEVENVRKGDLNNDGVIDISDFSIMLYNYNGDVVEPTPEVTPRVKDNNFIIPLEGEIINV